jgi:hypothetical protein
MTTRADEEPTEEVELEPGQAVPQGAFLIQVPGGIRLMWDLGDGLGFAWYTITKKQTIQIFGENWQSYLKGTYASQSAAQAALGHMYFWGNAAEIQATAESPWEQLKQSIFESYGHVAGFENDEIKRLILQGWWEGWEATTFMAHYHESSYYQSLSNLQREWAGLGEAEKQARIQEQAGNLLEYYRSQWGVDPAGGITDAELMAAAEAVASGELALSTWQYNTRISAEGVENTPAYRNVIVEQQAQGQGEVTVENLRNQVMSMWREWVGPVEMPTKGWAQQWAQWLYMNERSEAELEERLKAISGNRWSGKDRNLSWSEWATAPKNLIQQTLELGNVDDDDALLNRILTKGLQGEEAITAIRHDPRYEKTNGMYRELSSTVAEIGRRFGFVAY